MPFNLAAGDSGVYIAGQGGGGTPPTGDEMGADKESHMGTSLHFLSQLACPGEEEERRREEEEDYSSEGEEKEEAGNDEDEDGSG